MEPIALFYVRFTDDILVLSPTRWRLRKAVKTVNQMVGPPRLEKHPDKTLLRQYLTRSSERGALNHMVPPISLTTSFRDSSLFLVTVYLHWRITIEFLILSRVTCLEYNGRIKLNLDRAVRRHCYKTDHGRIASE